MKNIRTQKSKFSFIVIIVIVFIFAASFAMVLWYASKNAEPHATPVLLSVSPHVMSVQNLPYNVGTIDLPVFAESAIIIDAATGSILFEKNADRIIPPASMAKLAVMYVVFQELAKGTIHLDDVVPLPAQSWAVNAPPRSSLMFLDQGQQVTVDELLLGLSVASGNDAAIALALYISQDVDAFCGRMTQEMRNLGLTKTTFVESSGYSEKNITTAREFALFSKIYIEKYPESLQKYHSVEKLIYPQLHNMPEFPQSFSIQQPVTQFATNKLLTMLEGCDGLKTGYIEESGYNLALTVQRSGSRFISVTMGGPGSSSSEGNKYRISDGKTLMDWAFTSFTTELYEPAQEALQVWRGTANAVNLIEAKPSALTVPIQFAGHVERRIEMPESLTAPVYIGETYGRVFYESDGYILQEIALIADRTIEKGSILKQFLDIMAKPFARYF